jgi:hypothetical protein
MNRPDLTSDHREHHDDSVGDNDDENDDSDALVHIRRIGLSLDVPVQ